MLKNLFKNKKDEDTEWTDIRERVEKAFKEQKWPREFFVDGKNNTGIFRYRSTFDLVSYLTYNAERDALSVKDYYDKFYNWNPVRDYPLDVVKKAERDEKGWPHEVQDLYIVNVDSREDLESISFRVMRNGPNAKYCTLRDAFSKLIEISKFKKDDFSTDDICSVIKCNIPRGTIESIVIPQWFDDSKIFYKNGEHFDGDLVDFAIALNTKNIMLKDIFSCYNDLKDEKASIDSESQKILSTFNSNSSLSYPEELNKSIDDFAKALGVPNPYETD